MVVIAPEQMEAKRPKKKRGLKGTVGSIVPTVANGPLVCLSVAASNQRCFLYFDIRQRNDLRIVTTSTRSRDATR